MNRKKIIYSIIEILLGAAMFVYGAVDDSPGGQLLGLVAIIVGIVNIIRSKKKISI